jgi:hypothetical protein
VTTLSPTSGGGKRCLIQIRFQTIKNYDILPMDL